MRLPKTHFDHPFRRAAVRSALTHSRATLQGLRIRNKLAGRVRYLRAHNQLHAFGRGAHRGR